jgi:hypothetical protein
MKTIEITDEVYDGLMAISREMNTQDHRSTAMPYVFKVMQKEQIAVPEGQGTEAWFMDGSLLDTDGEIEEAVNDYKEWDGLTTEYHQLDQNEIEDIMQSAGYRKVNYDYKDSFENAFFTEKACKEHIRLNKHNLNTPVDYLVHAKRNPEMELVSKFLIELTGGKLHK